MEISETLVNLVLNATWVYFGIWFLLIAVNLNGKLKRNKLYNFICDMFITLGTLTYIIICFVGSVLFGSLILNLFFFMGYLILAVEKK